MNTQPNFPSWFDSELHRKKYTKDHPAYLSAQEAWNAANDAAQDRINKLHAEIEAWKIRFNSASDALVKLNGLERKPVATMWQHGETGRTRITTPDSITDCDARWVKVSDLYTAPPPRQPWVGLTEDEKRHLFEREDYQGWLDYINTIEAKLKEKNT